MKHDPITASFLLACASLAAAGCGGDAAASRAHGARALEALAAGEWARAEEEARRVAAAGGESAHLGRFLAGNVAFARARVDEDAARAAGDAMGALARTALERALRGYRAALDAWRAAAVSRADWPAARRNAERAARRIAALEALREERGVDQPPPPPPPPAPGAADPDAPPPPQDVPPVSLSPEQLEELFERLRRQQREKQDARRQRSERAPGTERDW